MGVYFNFNTISDLVLYIETVTFIDHRMLLFLMGMLGL
jgi:hypothetical protein